MISNGESLCCNEDWLQKLQGRSRLYCLEPIGLGTGEVESATSYLARLSSAHAVSTWSLLKCEIAPRLFGPEAILRNRLSELTAAMGSACNGENQTSTKLILILRSLTCREDLDWITMGFCRGFVAPRFLVRREQAWCYVCLSEWKAQGREIYSPLLWHLMAVKMCPTHGVALKTLCPACGRSFHPLTAHSRPGYCSHCHKWLGVAGSSGTSLTLQEIVDQENAKLIADFLRDGLRTLTNAGRTEFPQNIGILLKSHFDNNVQALTRYVDVNRATVITWKNGSQRPTLLSLTDFSKRVNVAPSALLGTRLRGEDFKLSTGVANEPSRKRFFSPPKVNLERMHQLLEETLRAEAGTALSLHQLATQLGCNQSTLQRRFPELAEKVKQKYQKFRAIQKEVRAQLFRSSVRVAVMQIYKMGLYPSQSRVREVLPRSIDMREPVALDEWKRTLTELGFSHGKQGRKAA